MSDTTFTANDPSPESTSSSFFVHTSTSLHYVVTHVFLPVQLPGDTDHTIEDDLSLARAVCTATHAYSAHVYGTSEPQWHRITQMLDNLQASVQSEHLGRDHVVSQLRGMRTGDILTFFIRPQSAAIILTKRESSTLFESFEASPRSDAVEATGGSLICSYPGSAVEMPNDVFDDGDFQSELAYFLSRPNAFDSDLPTPPTRPQYITALLTGILRCVGRTADLRHITKRVRDNVGQWPSDYGRVGDWRRSPLWLVIRVAIQMSFDRSPLGRASYKRFMLFFTCTLARDTSNIHLSSDVLHLMSSKIFRRLSKLGTSTPDWLSNMALEACACLREMLDDRWIQLSTRSSPFRNPSQEELVRDTQLSLQHSHEYIRSALANSPHEPLRTPFHPSHRRRGTIDDFLSSNGSFFEEAYDAEPDVTLYDVEQSIEQGIDDWLARVTNVEEACAQLEILMDQYMIKANSRLNVNPEDKSIMLLTAIELFVVLDKLVVKEIPMLADYSPEIPIHLLEKLLLCKTGSLHRLSRAYQYLCVRRSQSHPGWSIVSNAFTEDAFTDDSFAVRYYNHSPHLQQLKTYIEHDAMEKIAGRAGSPRTRDGYQENRQHLSESRLSDGAKASQSPLPTSLVYAKVVIFELHCPACFRIWRSAASRILYYLCYLIHDHSVFDAEKEGNLLARVPALQPYFVCREGPPLSFQIHFVYFYQGQSRNSPTLRYAIQHPTFVPIEDRYIPTHLLSIWQEEGRNHDFRVSLEFSYSTASLGEYVPYTSHTSNDVLAAQADCPADLSLDEFITFGNLRSGGSLQWLNILKGLRSRSLNLRRHDVHFLLAQAAFQVGPLDLNTGAWLWHQELQDSSFCDALLDELNSLVVDVGAALIDGVMMSTISLLLSRVLASNPNGGISGRAIALLRSVRRKTFTWVQELSYNLTKAPTDTERSDRLRDMAAACRSTFGVDPFRKLFHSAEDVDAMLSCAFLIHTLYHKFINDEYSRLLLQRDCRLAFALEGILRDVILADVSDYGVDLAVGKIFAGLNPGAHRWQQLAHPNARWLTCTNKVAGSQPSQTVHFNLLDGVLRLDGETLGGLPRTIRDSPECQPIFREQGFFLVPSHLPGMDFTTFATTPKRKVHFSLRGDNMMIRTQCNQTNEILELIPRGKLYRDLPPALVDGHVHWLNLSTKVIEIHPLERLWEQSSENWRIDCASGQYHMYKGRETLVNIQSPTWAMISRCFECLDIIGKNQESPSRNFLITTSPIDSLQCVPAPRLSVALPWYGLSFSVNERGELESRDFKDMVYDENQCIDALLGLENLLVLRQKTHVPEGVIPRRVLIPSGIPKKHGDHHVRVYTVPHLSTRPDNLLRYHTYNVDNELGCLMGDASGSLMSTAYLAILHDLTSCHRPDPLTGKTGAQAALSLLESAGCRSIMKLKALNSDPQLWDSTQCPQIIVARNEILHRYYWDRNVYDKKAVSEADKRAARRAAHLFPWNASGATSRQDCDDMEYLTPESDLELEDVAFTAASAVNRWCINVPTMSTILNWAELWSDEMPADTAPEHSPHGGFGTRLDPDLVQTLLVKVHDILGKSEGTRQRFQLLFLLPTMAYCSPFHQAVFLSMLIAFAKQPPSQLDNPLNHIGCQILDGYRPTEEILRRHILESRTKELYSHRASDTVDGVVKHLLKHWPSDTPPTVSLDPRYWDMPSLTTNIQQLFSSCYHNFKLMGHLTHVLRESGLPTLPRPVSSLRYISNEDTPFRITLNQLLSNRPTPELPHCSALLRESHKASRTPSDDILTLDHLFSSFQTDSSFQQEYLAHLEASALRAREESRMTHRVVGKNRVETLKKHYAQCRVNYMDGFATVKQNLGPTADPHEQALDRFGQWPPISADVLLRYLASTSPINLTRQWKKCLVSLALLLLELQHARRLLRFALDGLEEEFSKELENEPCDGWNPEDYPDWLLIQVQCNFLIRHVQAETALEIISPQSGGNTVMQVNMGEGKSSVIIPIAATALADGNQLVRVVVPKALTVQMFELLVSRLGGLANRPIYHLPFFRSLEYDLYDRMTSLQVEDLHKLMSQCMAERGILLVQPEHVVSLKLMSVEEQIRNGKHVVIPLAKLQKFIFKRILSSKLLPEDSLVGRVFQWLSQSPNQSIKKDITHLDNHGEHSGDAHGASDSAFKWMSLQKWMHSHVRDILDESDEVLHSRFQLIYTIGHQQHMDGYPDRWTITQQILRLVKRHACSLSRYTPDSVEYQCGPPGSFPYIRIVQPSDVGRRLILLIAEDVMDGQLLGFKFQNICQELHDGIHSFISDEDVFQVPDTATKVEEYAKESHQSNLWSGLLLLRGLLASNVLLFALSERRWRVDYGLASPMQSRSNTMLAVPYRAKDIPAPNTQFGHPDITIILTCLSYYYAGLSEEQLRVSFEILLDLDDPFTEYALWVKEYDCDSVPDSFRELGEINLRSSEQWDEVIFPLFARNQATVDFYLSRVVFPQEAKEFPWKISGSIWDLAEKRERVITGISGTNDGRWLLPTSVTQHDLDHHKGTNGRVLGYLLRPENDSYMVTHENGERWTTRRFLQMVAEQQPTIRVLLDVGAQILDCSNRRVAEAWLDIARDIAGAIYFNENDDLMVLTRNGITQPMLSSSLSEQLGSCVVYLDHVHTRGTDIKLPMWSRGAVTLGSKVTKDHLVQGCMRLRKLGHGHSVMFFAPLGVDRSIRVVTGKRDPNARITTVDILCWAIHETWTDIQQRAPHWAQQGMTHKSRYDAWSRFCNNELGPDQLSNAWLQPELKSLANLYAPRETKSVSGTLSALDPGIRQRCRKIGVLSVPDAQMEEEQEREVNSEREREREMELPPWAEPAEHSLHPDVVKFVTTGKIPPLHTNSGFHPVFTTLEKSSAATRDADVWSPYILATADFCQTVKPESTQGTMDQYLRPVQWILSRKDMKDHDKLLVFLSPFEADRLMPDIRASEYVHLHVYAPRTSQRMKPSDDLTLSIPPLPSDWTPPWDLIDQLNVFAGQLYLRDRQSYLRLCRFLGVPTKDSPDDAPVRWNLFDIPGSFEENEIRFSGSPLPCVWALLAIRNRGRPFTQTHMGKILQGQLLTEKDFERPTPIVFWHSSATWDGQIQHEATSEIVPPSPSGMDWGTQEDLSEAWRQLM